MLHSCMTRVDAIRHGNQPELGQHVKCPQHRMSGKRNLLCRGKNPEANDRRLVCRRQHEHSLGEVHLPSNLLQLIVGETLRLREHGDRVAAERLPGEHVGLIKFRAWEVRRSLYQDIVKTVRQPSS